jgi:hypothetical protein
MVRLKVMTGNYNQTTKRYSHDSVLEVEIDGQDIRVLSGDDSYLSLDVPVVDPDTRQSLSYQENPERWALLLPTAYRAGDFTIESEKISSAPLTV